MLSVVGAVWMSSALSDTQCIASCICLVQCARKVYSEKGRTNQMQQDADGLDVKQ